MKIQGIYKIKNIINNKIYIGQSQDILLRFKQHKRNIYYCKKHLLYNSFRKYGIENFEFIIIEEVKDVNMLDLREQCWLDYYQSYLSEKGYNLRHKAESMRGYKHSKETKDKIAIAHVGKKHSDISKLKIGLGNKGKKCEPFAEEHKRKIGLANKGKIPWNKGIAHTEETRNKIAKMCKGKPSGHKGIKHSKEARDKMSESHIQRWKNKKNKDNIINFKKAV